MKKLIIIEGENDYQCETIQDIVKKLIDENYYSLTSDEKKEKMKAMALANTVNNKMTIIDEIKNDMNINGKFIIKDEITYILSLLITNNILLLERKDSNIFVNKITIKENKDNYVIINKFAKELLKKYIDI